MKRKPAIFLDRDGTLLTERGYLSDPQRIFFYPFVFSALKALQKAGYKLVIITNQSGVGRGYFSLRTLDSINRRFKKLLMKKGIHIHGIYFCPHRPDVGCVCRKPKPGLVQRAARQLKIDVAASFVVGDQRNDLLLAKALGIPGILVLTGAGRSQRNDSLKIASKVTRTISTATQWILSQTY